MFLPHNTHHLENARELRRNMTEEERHLWYDFLRMYPVKVMKQKPIGNYIVDFFCEAAKLVIELDGSQHFEDEGLEADAKRTEYLEKLGLLVVRYSNREVNQQFQTVCADIDRLITERTA